jgi:hypothetical protein
MKTTILRAFLITFCLVLLMQGLQAQWGRGRGHSNHNYNRYYSYSRPRVSIGIYSQGYYRSPRYYSPGYYHSPGYYRPSIGFYGSWVRPRIGIHVNVLPPGYWGFYMGPSPYYYYGGAYYRPGPRPGDYEVIDAPLGASVPELPHGAKVVVINEQKFYELDGTYYKEDIRDNNEIWYTVVGKNGKVDTDYMPAPDNGPKEGDVIDKLPEGSRKVTLNGKTYFVSPDDVYYEETMEHNTVKYRVAGQ